MKKLSFCLLPLLLVLTSHVFAQISVDYPVIQLTDNGYDDISPLSDNGDIVWFASDGHDTEIYLSHAGIITQLTNNEYSDRFPCIDNGQVVWSGFDGNVFQTYLWQDGTITQLSDSNYYDDLPPDIENGLVAWVGGGQIFIWENGITTQLTDAMYSQSIPKVSNGCVTWAGYDGHDLEIYLWQEGVITQLTNNDYDDYQQQMHQGMIVWVGSDGHDNEIYLWEDGIVRQLTYNEYADNQPQIEHGLIVWAGSDGHDYEIYLWKDGIITQLTNNDYDDFNPQINNGRISWCGSDGNDNEIYLWRDGVITQLTNNNYNDQNPRMNKESIVWSGSDGNDNEIFFCPINKPPVIQLTNNPYSDFQLRVKDGMIVWTGFDGNDNEIYLYQNGQVIQITDNSYSDVLPQTDKKMIVWTGWDGGDDEIYLWQDGIITQITDNNKEDYMLAIDDGQIVWEGYDGHDLEIYLWQDGIITQITDNDYNDFGIKIANGQIVWQGYDGHDMEIYLWQDGIITQITNNDCDDNYPQIDAGQILWVGENGYYLWKNGIVSQITYKKMDDWYPVTANGLVAWYDSDGHDQEIFLWRDGAIIQLTDNEYDDKGPQIFGDFVFYHGFDGHDNEIFLWRNGETTQITYNYYDDFSPQFDNGMLVWRGFDGKDYEIFLCPDILPPEIELSIRDYSGNWVPLTAEVAPGTVIRATATDYPLEHPADLNPVSWNYRLDGISKQATVTPEGQLEITLYKGGNHTLHFGVSDNYRNRGELEASVTVTASDTTPPVITTYAPEDWVNAAGLPAVASATATDNGTGINPASWYYQLDETNGAWLHISGITDQTAPATVPVSREGETTVYFKVSDYAGNTVTGSTTIRIDTTPPSFTGFTYTNANGTGLSETNGGSPWDKTAHLTVTSLAEDTNGSLVTSGIDALYWSTDNTLPLSSWQQAGTATISSEGATTLYFQAVDYGGNSRVTSRIVRLDRTSPHFTPGVFTDNYLNNSILTSLAFSVLPEAFDELSGVMNDSFAYSFTPATGPWSRIPAAAGEAMDISSLNAGVHTLYLKASDMAGNLSESVAGLTFTIDLTPPVVSDIQIKVGESFITTEEYISSDTVEVVVDALDTFGAANENGQIASYVWELASEPLTSPSLPHAASAYEPFILNGLTSGTWYLYVAAVDEAGNQSPVSERLIKVDIEPLAAPEITSLTHPVAAGTEDAVSLKNALFTFTPPVTGPSGFSSYLYSLKAGTFESTATVVRQEPELTSHSLELLDLADNQSGEFYYLCVQMKSGNGRLSEQAVYTFRVDSTPPEEFTITSATHPLPAHYYPTNIADISWNRPPDFTGIQTFAYTVTTVSLGPEPDTTSGDWTLLTENSVQLPLNQLTGNASGEVFINVYAKDYAGNKRVAEEFSLRYDTVRPVIQEAELNLSCDLNRSQLSFTWTAQAVSDDTGIDYGSLALAQMVNNVLQPLGEAIIVDPQVAGTYSFEGLDTALNPVYIVIFKAIDRAGNEGVITKGINLLTGELIAAVIPFTQNLGGYTVTGTYAASPALQNASLQLPASLKLQVNGEPLLSLSLSNLEFDAAGELLYADNRDVNYTLSLSGFALSGSGLSVSKSDGLKLQSLNYTTDVYDYATDSYLERSFTYTNVSLSAPPLCRFMPGFLTAHLPACDFQTALEREEGLEAEPAWLLTSVGTSGFKAESWQLGAGELNLEPIQEQVNAYVLAANEQKFYRLPLTLLSLSALAVPLEGELAGTFFLEEADNRFEIKKALIRYDRLIILEAELKLNESLTSDTITLTNFSIDIEGKMREEAGFSSSAFTLNQDGQICEADGLRIIDGELFIASATLTINGEGLAVEDVRLTAEGIDFSLAASVLDYTGTFFGYTVRAPKGYITTREDQTPSTVISFPIAYLSLPAVYGGGEHELFGLVVALTEEQVIEAGSGNVNLPLSLEYNNHGSTPPVTVLALSLSPSGLLASEVEVTFPNISIISWPAEKAVFTDLPLYPDGTVGTTDFLSSSFVFTLAGFSLEAEAYSFDGAGIIFNQLTLALSPDYSPSTLYFSGLKVDATHIVSGATLQDTVSLSAGPWFFTISGFLLDENGLAGTAHLQLPEAFGGSEVAFTNFRVFADGTYTTGSAEGEVYLRIHDWLAKASSISLEGELVKLNTAVVQLYSIMGGGELSIPAVFVSATGELSSSGIGTDEVSFLATNGFKVDATSYTFGSNGLWLSGSVYFPHALGANVKAEYGSMEISLEADGAVLTPLETATSLTYYVGGFGIQAEGYQFDREGLLIRESTVPLAIGGGNFSIGLPAIRFAADGHIKMGGASLEGFNLSLFDGNIQLGITEIMLSEEGLNLKAFVGLPPTLGAEFIYFDKLTLHPDGSITTDVAVPQFHFSLFNFDFLLRNIRFDEHGFSIGEGIIQLPETLGSKTLRLINFRIDSHGDFSLGGVGMDPFSLWGYTFALDNLGYADGIFSFEGRIILPDDFFVPQLASQTIQIADFKVSTSGEIVSFLISLSGEYNFTLYENWRVQFDTFTISKQFLSIDTARLFLPEELGLGGPDTSIAVHGIVFDFTTKHFSISEGISVGGLQLQYGDLKLVVDSLNISETEGLLFAGSLYLPPDLPLNLGGTATEPNVFNVTKFQIKPGHTIGDIEASFTAASPLQLLPGILNFSGTIGFTKEENTCYLSCYGGLFTFGSSMPAGLAAQELVLSKLKVNVTDKTLELLEAGADIPVLKLMDYLHLEGVSLRAYKKLDSNDVEFSVGADRLGFSNSILPDALKGLSVNNFLLSIDSAANINLTISINLPEDPARVLFGDVYLPSGNLDIRFAGNTFTLAASGAVCLGSSFPEGLAGTRVTIGTDHPLLFSSNGGLLDGQIIIDLAPSISMGALTFKEGKVLLGKDESSGTSDFYVCLSGYFELPDTLPLTTATGENVRLTVEAFKILASGKVGEIKIGLQNFSANIFNVIQLTQGNISVRDDETEGLIFRFTGNLQLPQGLPGSFSAVAFEISNLEFSTNSGLLDFSAATTASLDFEIFSAILLKVSKMGLSKDGISLTGSFTFKAGTFLAAKLGSLGAIAFNDLQIGWNGEITNINASISEVHFTLAGFAIDVEDLTFNREGVSLGMAVLKLPDCLEGKAIVLQNAGFTWEGNFYGEAGLSTLEFDIAGFQLTGNNLRLNLAQDNTYFSFASVKARLPAFLGGFVVDVNSVTISSEGLAVGGGTFSIPDFTIAGGLGFRNIHVRFSATGNDTFIEGGGEVIIPGAGGFSTTISFTKRSDEYPWGIKRIYFTYTITGIGIQLGTTPLYLNQIVGGLTFGPPDEMPKQLQGMFDSGTRLSLGVVIADATGGDVFKGSAMLWIDVSNWGIAFKADATILKGFISAELIAALNKKGFYGSFAFEIVFAKGKIEVFIFPYNGRLEFSGRGSVQFGIPAHKFLCIKFRIFWKRIHWGLLPWDIWLPPIGAEFGLFRGGKHGFKGFVNAPVIGEVGIFVGKGEFKLGNVSSYKLYTPFETSSAVASASADSLSYQATNKESASLAAKSAVNADNRVIALDRVLGKRYNDSKCFTVPRKTKAKKQRLNKGDKLPSTSQLSTGESLSPVLSEAVEEDLETVDKTLERLVLVVAYGEGNPKVTAISPSNIPYSTEHEDVEVFRSEEGLALAITNPEPGDWRLVVEDLIDPTAYVAQVVEVTKVPELSLTEPATPGEIVNGSITVSGNAAVHNGTVPSVKLYLSSNKDAFLGREVGEVELTDNGAFSTTLDVSNLADGEYFIYAGLSDSDLNPAKQVYAPGSFVIRNTTPLLAPVNFIAADNGHGGIDLSFDDPNGERSYGYKLYTEDLSVPPGSTDPFECAQEEFQLGTLTQTSIPGFKSGHTIRLRVVALDYNNQEGASTAALEVIMGAGKEQKNEFSFTVEEFNLNLNVGESYTGTFTFITPHFYESLSAYDYLEPGVVSAADGLNIIILEKRIHLSSGEVAYTLNVSDRVAPGSYPILLRFANMGNTELKDEVLINLVVTYPPVVLNEVVVPHDWNIIEDTELEIYGANFFAGTRVYLDAWELPLLSRNPAETNPLASDYLDPTYLKVTVPAYFNNLSEGDHLLRVVGPAADEVSRIVKVFAPNYTVLGHKTTAEIPAGGSDNFYFTIFGEDRFYGTAHFHLEGVPTDWNVTLLTPSVSEGQIGIISVTVPYTEPLGMKSFNLVCEKGHIQEISVIVSETYPSPHVSSLSCLSALVGEEVSIYGYGFGESGSVKLGELSLPVLSYAPDCIRVQISEGAVNGNIIVQRSDNLLSNPFIFFVKNRSFSLYPALKRVELQPGESRSLKVQVLGCSEAVELEVINQEEKLSATLSATSVVPNSEVSLTISALPDIANGIYPLQLSGRSGALQGSSGIEVVIGSAFAFSSETLPVAMENCTYEVPLRTINGTGTVTFSLEEGSLPLGLSLSPEGLLFGKAKEAGSWVFTVKAADEGGHTLTKEFSLIVEENGWSQTDKDNSNSRYNPIRSPADSRSLWVSEAVSGREEILVAGKCIYVKGEGEVSIIDRATGRLLFIYTIPDPATGVSQWAYGGKILFVLDNGGTLHALDGLYGFERWHRDAVSYFSLKADTLYLFDNTAGNISLVEPSTGALLSVNTAEAVLPEKSCWFAGDFYRSSGAKLYKLSPEGAWLEVFDTDTATGEPGTSITALAADSQNCALLTSGGHLFLFDTGFGIVAEKAALSGAGTLGLSAEQVVLGYIDKLQLLTRPSLDTVSQIYTAEGEFALSTEKIFHSTSSGFNAYNRYSGDLIWQKAGAFKDVALAGEIAYALAVDGRLYAFNAPDNLTPPRTNFHTVPEEPDGMHGYFNTCPLFSLSAKDEESYVTQTLYRINGEAEVPYTGAINLEEGEHFIYYRSTDNHGYGEPTRMARILVDATAPLTDIHISGELVADYYHSPVTIHLTAEDSGSGVEEVYYQCNGGVWQLCSGSIYLDTEGAYSVKYQARDTAGNWEAVQTVEFKINLSNPAVDVNACIEAGLGIVNLSATDTYPGIEEFTYSLDGGATVLAYSGPLVFNQSGTYTVSYYARDLGGRESGWQATTITVPTIAEGNWVGDVTYLVTERPRAYGRNAGVGIPLYKTASGTLGTISALPSYVVGADYLLTNESDKSESTAGFVRFKALIDVEVYIFKHQLSTVDLSMWTLMESGFPVEPSEYFIGGADVYSRHFKAGDVITLPGSGVSDPSGYGNLYFIQQSYSNVLRITSPNPTSDLLSGASMHYESTTLDPAFGEQIVFYNWSYAVYPENEENPVVSYQFISTAAAGEFILPVVSGNSTLKLRLVVFDSMYRLLAGSIRYYRLLP